MGYQEGPGTEPKLETGTVRAFFPRTEIHQKRFSGTETSTGTVPFP